MANMKGSQALVRQLKAEGVEVVFALPGTQIMQAYDSFHELGDIRLISVRHEQATTYMATGYAQATGKVGVALVVPGPGAINAGAGLGTAYATSQPVLMISGQNETATLGKRRGALHEVDEQLDMFRPITKWNHRIMRPGEVPEAVHEAFRQMRTGRPRPVELELPPDVMASEDDTEIIEPEEFPPAAPDPRKVQDAAEILARAQRPLIIAGGGTITSGASQELLEVAEFLQAPVVTSSEGKGIIPGDHYLMVGHTQYGGLGTVRAMVQESDVVMAVGTRLVANLEIDQSKQFIHIDVDEVEIGKFYPTQVGILSDARLALTELIRQLKAKGPPRESRRPEIEALKARNQDLWRSYAPQQISMVESIRKELDEDAIVVSGMTTLGYWSHLTYDTQKPRTYITSSYFGTLGYAFPTSLGAKVGQPDKHVVALCGDGGFMYSPQELATAVQYGINTVAMVFNNSSYGASRHDQKVKYGEHYIGTELHNPDFVKLAESFGAVGLRADSPEEMGPMLRKALTIDKPVLLEVVLPIMMPPFQVQLSG